MLTKYANSCYAHCNWLCDAAVGAAVVAVAISSRSLDLVCSSQLCVSQLCKVSCVEPLTMNCKCEQRATWAAAAAAAVWCVVIASERERERESACLAWLSSLHITHTQRGRHFDEALATAQLQQFPAATGNHSLQFSTEGCKLPHCCSCCCCC